MPRWLRGEFERARRRRERDLARPGIDVDTRIRAQRSTVRFQVSGERAFRQLLQAMEVDMAISAMVPGLPDGEWFVESLDMRGGRFGEPVTDVVAVRAETWGASGTRVV